MAKLIFQSHLEDKIFEIKFNSDSISKIVSYFPFNKSEKQEIQSILKNEFNGFYSVFIDSVTDEEWNRTKEQIKKKFNDELFDIETI